MINYMAKFKEIYYNISEKLTEIDLADEKRITDGRKLVAIEIFWLQANPKSVGFFTE